MARRSARDHELQPLDVHDCMRQGRIGSQKKCCHGGFYLHFFRCSSIRSLLCSVVSQHCGSPPTVRQCFLLSAVCRASYFAARSDANGAKTGGGRYMLHVAPLRSSQCRSCAVASAGNVGSRSPSSDISGVSHSAGGRVVVGSMPELVFWGAHISRLGKMDHIQNPRRGILCFEISEAR